MKDSIESEILEYMIDLGVPFDEAWDEKEIIMATILYLDKIFEFVGKERQEFVKKILNTRYKTFFQQGNIH